jgi:hypothetical protein
MQYTNEFLEAISRHAREELRSVHLVVRDLAELLLDARNALACRWQNSRLVDAKQVLKFYADGNYDQGQLARNFLEGK